ncbi:crotonobetainyl-CoA:carnitine CoA-transferase CaiB-like acyl-CoA transferase [Actinomadura pelletieri DSM 43383]|uniref:Crotonobetainyl-CoA:carnitine CoA-transferase CaiB-like acyl-CoA transferase n=1 Tax=Actinomadura pelletieri DSM 43383 TaxID=1120940 RepID=A0A495QY21_9ACTN|nr:CoA transferase [Actinomadura pelletieri]RKS78957.1 crotonobetainyl-CoA:carnitine CoA-transferase CaiB-like acyl-CoA transferase [Actinomadura pelletieri DSM 43383]
MEPPDEERGGDPNALRVVELSGGVATKICGRLLAGLGHEVILCEPPGGDALRTRPPLDGHGVGLTFASLDADKRSVVADLDTADGRTTLNHLLERADVLLTDLGPARARTAGLTAPGIRGAWPGLVAVSITAAGLDDPRSDHPGDSLLAECHGGLAAMIGEPDRAPLSLGGEQAAHAGAFAGLLGAMLALRRRALGGGGDVVDVALCDVAAYIDWKSDIETAVAGTAPTRTGATAGQWRIVRAADGWVGVIFHPDQWDVLIELVNGSAPTSSHDPEQWWPVIERWAADLPKRTIYERAQALGLAVGFSADLEDLREDGQYRSRGFFRGPGQDGRTTAPVGPPARATGLPWRSGPPPALNDAVPTWTARPAPPPPNGQEAPLAGVTVLDLGTITAGAATGRLLADYGATVIKVESASHPDPFRQWPVAGQAPGTNGLDVSPMFESNNAGKLGVVLELKTEADRETLHRLAARADVVIENFTVGVTRRLGADFETLRAINPRLVYLSLSSQGQEGPEAGRRSYGSTLDLLSGLASVTGYPDGGPMWSSGEVNYPDQAASLFGAALVAYCLERGVRGVHLDVSQRELITWTLADRIAEHAATGVVPEPTGNRRPGGTPHDVYPCAGDGQWVAIACHRQADRDALANLIAPAVLTDRSEQWWWEHEALVDELVEAWTRARPRAECVHALTEAGVANAPVLSAAERGREPRFRERRVFLGDRNSRRKGFPFTMRDYTPPDPAPAPNLGQDQEAVLASLIEMDAALPADRP